MAFSWKDLSTTSSVPLNTWWGTYLPALVLSAVLGGNAIHAILTKAGHPAVPLDDAFIHLQFAKNLAQGRFFAYVAGEGFVPGATSLLWPAVLAPFFWLGFKELSILWIAWVFGFLAHAALGVEVYRLTERLAGHAGAIAASAMTMLFGGFVWFAASGMETVPLAWIMVRTARLSAQWCEGIRVPSRRWELIGLAIVAPLVRPEGALASLIALGALQGFSLDFKPPNWTTRLLHLLPLVGPLLGPTINLIATGHASSTTMAVKWLPLNPYHQSFESQWVGFAQNARLFFTTILDGEQWSAVFLPSGSLPFAIAGLVAIPIAGWRTQKYWRALIVVILAVAILGTCTYQTFLWNRLRYLWPFFPGWFIGVACLSALIGELAGWLRPHWGSVGPVLGGLAAGALAGNLRWTIDDLAKSASAIDKQQVTLGRWANENLPKTARIGVNDTGAIAYLSGRPTFDIVGLTTLGEGQYWVAGPGSRFEHYERLFDEAPERLPSHFIVYPGWMRCEPILGKKLHQASVYDQSILGGNTMVAYETDTSLLGSGALPALHSIPQKMLDELDVADLISEREHAYDPMLGGASEDANKVIHQAAAHDGWLRPWADGARDQRQLEAFSVRLPQGKPVLAIARWAGPSEGSAEISVEAGPQVLATVQLHEGELREISFHIPPTISREQTPIRVRATHGTYGSLHYWFFEP